MSLLAQVLAELGADQAGSANDYDLHLCASLGMDAAEDIGRGVSTWSSMSVCWSTGFVLQNPSGTRELGW
ncbi:hypothetical protein D3C84_1261130 [compost metagenome]